MNVCELNFCCSRSLVKLMQSCSNEFFSKISKPKMSSTPIATPRSPPTAALIRLTSSSNIAEYTAFASASTASSAAFTLLRIRCTSPRTTVCRSTSAAPSAAWSTCR